MFNVTSINILVAAEDKESLLKTTESFVHNKQLAVNGYWLRSIDKCSFRSKRELLKSLGITRRLSWGKMLLCLLGVGLLILVWGMALNWIIAIPFTYYENPKFANSMLFVTFMLWVTPLSIIGFVFYWFRGRRILNIAIKYLPNKSYYLLLRGERNASCSIEPNNPTLFCAQTIKQLIQQIERKEI